MSAVSQAWERFQAVAAEAGASLGETMQPAPDRAAVARAFADAGMEATDELLDYFEVAFSFAAGSRIFPEYAALDLSGAIAERAKLTEFAVAEAPDYDALPDDLFPDRFFPVTQGKPTTSLDRIDGRVYNWWWDESEPRLVAQNLAEWIDQQAAHVVANPEQARNYYQPQLDRRPKPLREFFMGPGQVWLKHAQDFTSRMLDALAEGRTLVVSHAPENSLPGYEGLELVQANLVVRLLVTEGAPEEAIVLQPDASTDEHRLHRVNVQAIYDD